MDRSLFDEIFDGEVLPFIDEIQGNNGMVRKKDIEKCKEEIFSEYNALRSDLKDIIFGNRSEDKVLDRHKVAACICAAFLKVSVFDKSELVNMIRKTRQRVEAYFYYVNEMVAFQAGCIFLTFFMASECIGDRKRAERIIEEFPKLPPVKTSTLDCYDNVVFNLSQIKTEKIGLEHFDIYSYSMFFFMLENYYNTQVA